MERCQSPSIIRAPSQNRLLAALPQQDYQRMLPALEPFRLPAGWTVHAAGRPQRHLYFVTEGVVSFSCVMEDGRTAEFSTIGREGVVGVSLCLGGGSMSSQAVVIVEGFAFRLGADLLTKELGEHGPLLALLLRYTQLMMAETGQICACNRHHPLRKQLCRQILAIADHLPVDALKMTHELLASQLGVRREGVSQEAGRLQEEGLIQYRRGHLRVLDRPGLEAQACECYANVSRERERLFADCRGPLASHSSH